MLAIEYGLVYFFTKSYCLVTEAYMCKQLTHSSDSCYTEMCVVRHTIALVIGVVCLLVHICGTHSQCESQTVQMVAEDIYLLYGSAAPCDIC